MSDNESQNPQSPRTDPRLKSYLRKAAAIITAEKGLNADSRLKLQSLADHVKLPPELFAEALDRLQQNSASIANLTHYERAFVKFLDSELERVAGGIISPAVENEAIKLAKLKYEINGTRAQQLINARAEVAGLELISPIEAEAFAQQSIVDRIANATAIDEEPRSKLYKVGKKWGLSDEQVDRIIATRLSQNRASLRRSRAKPVVIIGIVFFAIVGSVGIAVSNGWIPARWIGMANIDDIPADGVADSTVELSSRFPDSLLHDLENLRTRHPRLDSPIAKILRVESIDRAQGYQSFIEQVCSTRGLDLNMIGELVRRLFIADSDPSASMIAKTLGEIIAAGQQPNFNVQDLKSAYTANRVVERILFPAVGEQPGPRERREEIVRIVSMQLNLPPDSLADRPSYQRQSSTTIATDQWNLLLQLAWENPAQASVFVQPLMDLTTDLLPADMVADYRDDVVSTIMKTDQSRWQILAAQIIESIEHCPDSRLMDWVAIFEATAAADCQLIIGKALLPRLGIESRTERREDISAAILQFRQNDRNQILRPLIERNNRLDEYVQNVNHGFAPNKRPTTPDEIAETAAAVNLQLVFCDVIEQATHIDDLAFTEFDRLIDLPKPRLRELISLRSRRRQPESATAMAATASDKRRMNASIDRLSDLSPESAGLRILALKQISQIAHRFERISYQDANVMAKLFLFDVGREELLNIERQLDSFTHWPNLGLAIADQLEQSEVPFDQAITIARLLLNREFDPGNAKNWPTMLSVQIVAAVNSSLESQIELDSSNQNSDWIRLQIYLTELYRERLLTAREPSFVDEEFSSPSVVVARIVETLIDQATASGQEINDQIESVSRTLPLLKSGSENEVATTAFANQLLIHVMAVELSQRGFKDPSLELLSELQNRLQQYPIAADQLYITELTLLQLLELKRKRMVGRLLKQEAR